MQFVQVRIRSYTKLLSHPAASMIVLILLIGSAISTNTASAQIPQTANPSVLNNSHPQTSHLQSQLVQSKIHGVKITSPTKDQQVQAGHNLVIAGTSADNDSSSCQVSVIVNGIKPYQNTTPTGFRGNGDYSKWSFMLTPKYTPLENGQNKITAKFSCGNDPKSVSHNSVNVTGVSANTTASIVNTNQLQKQQKQPLPIQTTRLGTNFTAANATSDKTRVPVLSNASSNSGGGKNNTIRALAASIHLGKNTIHPGEKQTITLKISDTNTSNAIAGAKVTGSIMNPSGSSKNFDGITDNSGKASYSWTVGHNDAIGRYKVYVQVSAFGYENNTASRSFKVSSIPVSSSNSNNDNNNSVRPNSGNSDTNNNNNNSNDNQNHNHPSTIISIPHIRIPEIRIPFHLPFR
jgi:hypothetical protein